MWGCIRHQSVDDEGPRSLPNYVEMLPSPPFPAPAVDALLHPEDVRPWLALAPMEGISDAIVRDLLSSLGGMDLTVTEFLRVAHRPIPEKVFRRNVPELAEGGRTRAGVPVFVQLLGGEPELVAESAERAVGLGALGIDLNFGCPAKRVNGSDGGASLLKTPRRVEAVVGATRNRIRANVPVSAKIRLGWDDPDQVVDIVKAADAGGASWITIHGRTKVQMYKPTADWARIRLAVEAVSTPIVANGDIFCPESLRRCREITGARGFMLGRGAFRRPNLFRWIRGLDTNAWDDVHCVAILEAFSRQVLVDPRFSEPPRVALNRLKGWTRAMGEARPSMMEAFHELKRMQTLPEALQVLRRTFPRAA